MIPAAFEGLDEGLVIVDWSGWLHSAFHIGGLDGMARLVLGQLVALLTPPAPRRVALAVDVRGPTHRHRMTADLEPKLRYKAGRDARVLEFYSLAARLLDVAQLLRVPVLWPDYGEVQDWEADDAAATATRLAVAAGWPVALLSRDKDWRQNVDDAARVIWWDGERKALDEAGVAQEHGVGPRLLADWLAIVGDTSDNVPGVRGLGPERASAILLAWGSLDGALAAAPLTPAELEGEAKALKEKRAALAKAKKKYENTTTLEAEVKAGTEGLSLWKGHWILHQARASAELSKALVTLRSDCPIVWDPDEMIVGGWDREQVAKALINLGLGHLAADLEDGRPKRSHAA